MTLRTQILTLAIQFDVGQVPLPEMWNWADVAKAMGGQVKIEVLASGQIKRVPEAQPA